MASTTVNFYQLTVPPMLRGLRALSNILKKGAEHAEAQKLNAEDFTAARIHADMQPLTFQIQRASDFVKLCLIRVGGTTALPMEDNEKTFEELQARVKKTIEYVEGVSEDEFLKGVAAGEDKVLLKLGTGDEIPFTKLNYVQQWALPNFYFHVTTTYDILRMKGVELGKRDYIQG